MITVSLYVRIYIGTRMADRVRKVAVVGAGLLGTRIAGKILVVVIIIIVIYNYVITRQIFGKSFSTVDSKADSHMNIVCILYLLKH